MTPAECFGYTLSRVFSTDGSAASVSDLKVLECIAALRSKGWRLLCSDVITDKPGCAIRTFFFEIGFEPSPGIAGHSSVSG